MYRAFLSHSPTGRESRHLVTDDRGVVNEARNMFFDLASDFGLVEVRREGYGYFCPPGAPADIRNTVAIYSYPDVLPEPGDSIDLDRDCVTSIVLLAEPDGHMLDNEFAVSTAGMDAAVDRFSRRLEADGLESAGGYVSHIFASRDDPDRTLYEMLVYWWSGLSARDCPDYGAAAERFGDDVDTFLADGFDDDGDDGDYDDSADIVSLGDEYCPE